MALYDTDKNSEDRGSPTPNHSDVVIDGATKAHMTISSAYKTDASTIGTLRMVLKNNLLLTYDTLGNISSAYGYVPGASSTTPVLIIANAGKDVFTDVLGIARPTGL
jgi:hypothetical protein